MVFFYENRLNRLRIVNFAAFLHVPLIVLLEG